MTRRGRILGVVVAGLALAVLGLAVVLGYDSPCEPPEPLPAGETVMKAIVYRCYGPPEVLALEDVAKQLAYDFLSDAYGGWENNDGAYGEFCFDAAARCIHLEFNERFTSSELYTHDF